MPRTRWRNTLWLVAALGALAAAFIGTKHVWFDGLTRGEKALFWPNVITAASTLGLLVVTFIALYVAYQQFLEFKSGRKARATTELLREWSKPHLRNILDFLDWQGGADKRRRRTRLLYRFVFSDELKPTDLRKVRQWRENSQERRQAIHGGIEDIALMASRTVNLINNDVVDADILFAQLDYDIVATYYTLEDVLALRQAEEEYLYSDFTELARLAQQHYRKRPSRLVVDEYVEARFEDLPFTDEEYAQFSDLAREQARRHRSAS